MDNKIIGSIDVESEKKINSKLSRYSVFILADKLFGFELDSVEEVLSVPKISKVPNVSQQIVGVFNLRGTILTLAKINQMLGLPSTDIYEESMIIVTESGNQKIGIIVDKVLDLVAVDESDIQLPTREMLPNLVEFIIGTYEKEGMGIIYLLNYKKLLAPQNFILNNNI